MTSSRSLTDGSISSSLFKFAAPILCANVLQSLSGSINSIWVGRYLGEAALTAVSNAQSVMLLLTGAVLGIAMAATILVGQCIGADDICGAKRVIGTGATFLAVISTIMAVTGLALSKPLLVAMAVPANSLPLAVSYLRIMFLALPTMYMYVFAMSILRGVGDATTPLYFMLLSVAIGIVLNPVLIFGLGPLGGAGVVGSALATFIGQVVSLAALVACLYKRRYLLCLYKKDLSMLRIDRSVVKILVHKGLPMGAQVLVVSLSSVLMIVLVNRFGVDTAAAFGISIQLWAYVSMPAISVGMAVSVMVALNIGRQQWDRVSSIARIGIIYSVLLTSISVSMLYLLDIHLYRLFLPSGSTALSIASHINSVVAWSFVLLGISIVLLSVVRAVGAVMVPLFVHTFSLLVVRFPLAATLMDQWQADAIWWSFPISSTLAVVLAALYYRYGGWRAV